MLVERNALITDSGGAGRYRGGLGIERVVRARTDVVFNTQIDRVNCAPWGLEGGEDGTGNSVALHLEGQWKEDFPNAKVLTAQLKEGEAFRLRSGGGGGFGEALQRPAEDVAEDVRQGYVSADAARDSYGLVVDEETGEIDQSATDKLRG